MTSYKGIVVLKHFGTLSPCLYWHAVIIFKYHVEEEELRPFLLHLGKLLPGWIFSWHFQSLTPETASSNVGNVMTKGHVILRNRASFSFSLLGRISTRYQLALGSEGTQRMFSFFREERYSHKRKVGVEKNLIWVVKGLLLCCTAQDISMTKSSNTLCLTFFFFSYMELTEGTKLCSETKHEILFQWFVLANLPITSH